MSFSDTAIHLFRGRSGTSLRGDEFVRDHLFISLVRHIQMLRGFMLEEKLSFSPDELEEMDLGKLNNLRYHASARVPTDVEWDRVYKVSSAVAAHLNGTNLKRKIRIRELGKFFGTIPLTFLFFSVISTFLYLAIFETRPGPFMIDIPPNAKFLASAGLVFIWALSQGGLGACAFLGTSVITRSAEAIARAKKSPDENLTESDIGCEVADITDRNFLKSRIVMGALFGFLLGLPIARSSLHIIYRDVNTTNLTMTATSITLMVMPFAIGFSTNLVLALFSKFIVVIQALFSVQTRG